MDQRDGVEAAPREIIERLLAAVASGPTSELADLYAPDAVVELPFAGPGGLVLRGRNDLRTHFDRAGRGSLPLVPEDVVIYDTTDPEVAIAEYTYRVDRPEGAIRLANVQIVRVREGLIVASRDFHDHAGLRAAMQSR